MGNDNSLTLGGCKEKLENEISIAQFLKEIKKAGLSRKPIKKDSMLFKTIAILIKGRPSAPQC